jgi:hypothetical protein
VAKTDLWNYKNNNNNNSNILQTHTAYSNKQSKSIRIMTVTIEEASSANINKATNKKKVLCLDGFHKVPWMMERLEEFWEEHPDNITYKVINCFERDPKSMERKFAEDSITEISQALETGTFHAICVIDLNDHLQVFQEKLGPMLRRFCRDGGAIAFPVSELNALVTLQGLFDTQWLAGDYSSTTWILCAENDRIPDYFGEENLLSSFKGRCVSLLNVPEHEKIYGVPPSERGMQTPTTPSEKNKTAQEEKIDVERLVDDYNVSVAVHNYGNGCISLIGDVNLDQPEWVEQFLMASSPVQPLESFAKLGKDIFRTLQNYKQQGNTAFSEKKYAPAIEAYQKAIDVYGQKAGSMGAQQEEYAKLYSNMAECYLRTEQYHKSVEAATLALQRDPQMVKAVIRCAKAHLKMAEKERNRHYLELAKECLNSLNGADFSKDEQTAISEMTQKVDQRLLHFAKKEKDGFRRNFSAALSSA